MSRFEPQSLPLEKRKEPVPVKLTVRRQVWWKRRTKGTKLRLLRINVINNNVLFMIGAPALAPHILITAAAFLVALEKSQSTNDSVT